MVFGVINSNIADRLSFVYPEEEQEVEATELMDLQFSETSN
jgi:hypothetical protein